MNVFCQDRFFFKTMNNESRNIPRRFLPSSSSLLLFFRKFEEVLSICEVLLHSTVCQGSKWMVVNPVWFFLLYRFLAALLARSFTPQSTELHNICMFENLAYWGISSFYIPFFKSEQLKQHATCYRPSQITSRHNRFGESIRDESYLTDQGQNCNLRKQKLFGFREDIN